MAFRLARHSVGRPRKEFMRKSSMGSTVATPINLHFPCSSILSPLPLLFVPIDSSDVKTVSTSNGGALYILPAENQNLALNSRSTYQKKEKTVTFLLENLDIFGQKTLPLWGGLDKPEKGIARDSFKIRPKKVPSFYTKRCDGISSIRNCKTSR